MPAPLTFGPFTRSQKSTARRRAFLRRVQAQQFAIGFRGYDANCFAGLRRMWTPFLLVI
jgi:hypothetical protein